ncbi:hypothetical protein ACX1NA_01510 [Mycoplasma sp. VS276A1]
MNKKIFKKFTWILGATLTATTIPLTAVSCFYSDDYTVKYAQKFISKDGNGFSVKNRLTSQAKYNKPELVKFENALFDNVLLLYTFSNFNYSPKNIVDVDNNDYSVVVNDLYSVDYKKNTIAIQEKNIDKIKNPDVRNDYKNGIEKLIKVINEYFEDMKNNPKKYAGVPSIYRSISGFMDALSLRIEALENFKVYKSNVETGKVSTEIDETITKTVDDIRNGLDKYRNAKDFMFPMMPNSNETYEVTKSDAEAVLDNFLKDTPFYNAYIFAMNSDKDINKPFHWDSTTKSGSFNYRVLAKSYDSLPTSFFQTIQKKLLNSNEEFNFNLVASKPKEAISNVFDKMKTNYSKYNVALYVDDSRGMKLGFSPEYLLQGIDPDDPYKDGKLNASQDFLVFNIEKVNDKEIKSVLTEEEQSQFLDSPFEFYWTHIFDIYIYTKATLELQIESNKKTIEFNKAKINSSNNPLQIEKLKKLNIKLQNKIDNNIKELKEIAKNLKLIKDVSEQKMIPAFDQMISLRKKVLSEEITIPEAQTLIKNQIIYLEALNSIKGNAELSEELKTTSDISSLPNDQQLEKYLERIKQIDLKISSYVRNDEIAGDSLISKNANVKKGVDKTFGNIVREISRSKTNEFSLVMLYAQTLFANGLFKAQIIKGTNQALINDVKAQLKNAQDSGSDTKELKKALEQVENGIYWLEFYDQTSQKWFMYDVFKGYLSYNKNAADYPEFLGNKNYDINNEFFDKLPSGYSIDPLLADVAHVK